MKTKLFWAAVLGLIFLAGPFAMALEEAAPDGATIEKKPAAASDEARTTSGTPTAANAEYRPGYLKETLLTMKYLSTMLARRDKLAPEKLEETSKDIASFNEKLKALLGPEIIKELEAEEKALLERRPVALPKSSLASVRSALQIYYGDHNGVFPDNLDALIPDYLTYIPDLHLPDHEKTGRISVINSKEYDNNLSSAVTDSGGWLYFSSTDSINSGMLVIDCSHKSAGESLEWFRY
jgi:hypothetical protein